MLCVGGERRLFYQQPISGQRHGVRVMERLQQAGHDARPLLAAALLHDVGKARYPFRWWDRMLVVAVSALWPDRAAAWGKGDRQPEGVGRPFVIKRQHPAWGAAQAATAGSCEMTVALIGRHQDRPDLWSGWEGERLLRVLQWADDIS